MKAKQILAIIGIILLVAMYVATAIIAVVDKSAAGGWFLSSMFCTAIIPILIWLIVRYLTWRKKRNNQD